MWNRPALLTICQIFRFFYYFIDPLEDERYSALAGECLRHYGDSNHILWNERHQVEHLNQLSYSHRSKIKDQFEIKNSATNLTLDIITIENFNWKLNLIFGTFTLSHLIFINHKQFQFRFCLKTYECKIHLLDLKHIHII